MPNPYLMWSGAGTYGFYNTVSTSPKVVATVPPMTLSSKAKLFFTSYDDTAGRFASYSYRRFSDGVVLSWGNLVSQKGCPGTPFGWSTFGSIAGTGSILGNAGGQLIVSFGSQANGGVTACIIDGGEDLPNNAIGFTEFFANGNVQCNDASVAVVENFPWYIAISAMIVDHAQLPVLDADPDWEVAASGLFGAIAIRAAPAVFPPQATSYLTHPTWRWTSPSTFTRSGHAHVFPTDPSQTTNRRKHSSVQFVG